MLGPIDLADWVEIQDGIASAPEREARADAAAVIVHLEVEPRVTLAEQNRDFAGVGVFAAGSGSARSGRAYFD